MSRSTFPIAAIQTASDLDYGDGEAVLCCDAGGRPALWVEDLYALGWSDIPGLYTLNDLDNSWPLDGDVLLRDVVIDWVASFGDAGPP